MNQWHKIISFSRFVTPEFPVDTLPPWLRNYAKALADFTQTPIDLPAMIALAVISIACAGKFKVQVRPGHVEPINLYGLVGMESGSGKSPVFNLMLQRVRDFEQGLIEGAIAADDPFVPTLLVDDITAEALAQRMAENGGRMAMASDEGGIFTILDGRYSHGKLNLDIFLKGHSGGLFVVHRKGKRPEIIRDPCLTMILAVQPDVIRSLARVAAFRTRGLLARFAFCLPENRVGLRNLDSPPVPDSVRVEYESNVAKMLAIPPTPIHLIDLTTAAFDERTRLAAWIEPQLRQGAELFDMVDWASKLAGTTVRVAALLHAADLASDAEPWRQPIPGPTMERAVKIAMYFIEHAKAAFNLMGADPVIDDAMSILSWIRSSALTVVSRRDIHRAMQARFHKATNIDPALVELESRGYIRRCPPVNANQGRPPSPVFDVNPEVHAGKHRPLSTVISPTLSSPPVACQMPVLPMSNSKTTVPVPPSPSSTAVNNAIPGGTTDVLPQAEVHANTDDINDKTDKSGVSEVGKDGSVIYVRSVSEFPADTTVLSSPSPKAPKRGKRWYVVGSLEKKYREPPYNDHFLNTGLLVHMPGRNCYIQATSFEDAEEKYAAAVFPLLPDPNSMIAEAEIPRARITKKLLNLPVDRRLRKLQELVADLKSTAAEQGGFDVTPQPPTPSR